MIRLLINFLEFAIQKIVFVNWRIENNDCIVFLSAYLVKVNPQETESVAALTQLAQEVKATIDQDVQADVKHEELKKYFQDKQLALTNTPANT